MEFRRLNEAPDFGGLLITRRPGEGIFLANIGMITFDGYGKNKWRIHLSTQDFLNGELSEPVAKPPLINATPYVIANTEVRLVLARGSRSVDFFIRAPRSIGILRSELMEIN
jgi:hypothetical protein